MRTENTFSNQTDLLVLLVTGHSLMNVKPKKKYLNRIEPFGPPDFVAYKLKHTPINTHFK